MNLVLIVLLISLILIIILFLFMKRKTISEFWENKKKAKDEKRKKDVNGMKGVKETNDVKKDEETTIIEYPSFYEQIHNPVELNSSVLEIDDTVEELNDNELRNLIDWGNVNEDEEIEGDDLNTSNEQVDEIVDEEIDTHNLNEKQNNSTYLSGGTSFEPMRDDVVNKPINVSFVFSPFSSDDMPLGRSLSKPFIPPNSFIF